jgi:hypothetical protein
MEELFYFPSLDLLIKTTYSAYANSLRYATHRSIVADERKVVEHYVLSEVGPKTEYYRRSPSLLLYIGVDASLEKELRFYRLQETIKDVLVQKEALDKQVKDLITKSLSNYYFERVGDELVTLRKLLIEGGEENRIREAFDRIGTLLDAYNENSGQQIAMDNVLPKEMLVHFHQPSEQQV